MANYTDVRVICAGCFGFLTSTVKSSNPQHSCFDVKKQNFLVGGCPHRVAISGYRPCTHSHNGQGFCGLRGGCPFEHCENLEELLV